MNYTDLVPEVERFTEWIKSQGWSIAALTNEWEVLRYKSDNGWNIVYRNKKGRLSWGGDSQAHFTAFERGNEANEPVVVEPMSKGKRRHVREELTERDGHCCWYCGEFFDEEDFVTIEHLVPRSEGGGHQLANLVLAHRSCNSKADNAPLAHKIEMRDRLKTLVERTPPWGSVRAA